MKDFFEQLSFYLDKYLIQTMIVVLAIILLIHNYWIAA